MKENVFDNNNKSINKILYKRAQNNNNNATNYFNNVLKNSQNILLIKMKEDKLTAYLSQIQMQMSIAFSPKNINNILTYFEYLGA